MNALAKKLIRQMGDGVACQIAHHFN